MCKQKLIQFCQNEEDFSFTVKTAICLTDVDDYMLNDCVGYMILYYMIQTHKAE